MDSARLLDVSLPEMTFFRFLKVSTYCLRIFLVSLLFTACSVERLAIKSSTAIFRNTVLALNEEEDPDFAEKAVVSQLKMLEGMIKTDPHNHDLLLFAARGFCSYAFSFIEDHDRERAKIFYRRGLHYGMQVLTTDKSKAEAFQNSGEKLDKALSNIGRKNLPHLFWATYCWGSLINLSRNSPDTLIALPKVKQMMERVLQLDESYFYGAAHLFFGVLYGSLPPMLGGKPEKAKYHFESALRISHEKFLQAFILYAKSYAIQVQDKKLFKRLLKKVIDSPPDILPSQRLANKLAKIKAEKLLQNIDEYF